MKTPQRNFVVEFKSGRRQPKAGPASIWGNTDFKALVREVEDRVPHLFNSNEAPGTPEEGGDMPPDPMSSGSASEYAGDANVAPAAIPSVDGAEFEGPQQHATDFPTAETGAQVQEIQPASLPPATAKSTRRKRAPTNAIAPIVMVTNDDRSAPSMDALDPVSFDEVAALDAENKRLKTLLAERLHAQNLRLRKMLERFDIT
jgi:hypothetical protein